MHSNNWSLDVMTGEQMTLSIAVVTPSSILITTGSGNRQARDVLPTPPSPVMVNILGLDSGRANCASDNAILFFSVIFGHCPLQYSARDQAFSPPGNPVATLQFFDLVGDAEIFDALLADRAPFNGRHIIGLFDLVPKIIWL